MPIGLVIVGSERSNADAPERFEIFRMNDLFPIGGMEQELVRMAEQGLRRIAKEREALGAALRIRFDLPKRARDVLDQVQQLRRPLRGYFGKIFTHTYSLQSKAQ